MASELVYLLRGILIIYAKDPNFRAGANESKKTRNKKQETKRFSTFTVYRLRHSETKIKHCLIRESRFLRNMCETANQQSISSHMVVYMACKMRCR